MKNKAIYIITSLFAVLVVVLIILLIHNYNATKYSKVNELYGVVKSVNNDSIVVQDANTLKEETFIKDYESDYKEGDFVYIKTDGKNIKSHQIIIDNYSSMTSTTKITTTTTTTTTSSSVTTTSNPVIRYTTKITKSADDTVLDYIKEEYNKIKNSDNVEAFKEGAKKAFITTVDFIFYDGEIKGYTFKEIKTATKAKVIYYALLIDSGIESKIPDYKDKLSSKYNDIKGKLIAEYLELKYDICTQSPDGCAQAKEDFALLKNTLNLTWNSVKELFKYIKDLSVPKIKDWYESFRG